MSVTRAQGRASRFFRLLLPALGVLIWLSVTAVGGQTFGQLSEVVSNEQITFLPAEAESTQALELSQQFSDDDAVPATVIAEPATAEIAEEQMAVLEEAVEEFGALDEVVQALPAEASDDGEAAQLLVLLDEAEAEDGAVETLRTAVEEQLPEEEWTAHVTGPAALSEDFAAAFAGIDGLLLVVALVAVFSILVLVYRSVLLPLVVLLSAVGALCASIIVVFHMASNEWIQLNGQAQGILSILVIGAATNYSLLMVARYREELLGEEDRFTALRRAWRRSLPPIVASGGTVAAALLCLLISDLNSNQALGPVAATGIVFAMVTTLTFLPALLALLGRPAFWPKIPRALKLVSEEQPGRRQRRQGPEHSGHWTGIAEKVRRRPRRIWLVVTVLLMIGAAGALDLRADGVSQSEQVLGETEVKAGQQMLERHFDAGTGAPADVFVPTDQTEDALEIIEPIDGVSDAFAVTEVGSPAQSPQEAAEAEGYVQLSVTLSDAADSPAAESTVIELREQLDQLDAETLVGGTSATQLDTNQTAQRDLVTIIPLILAVILVFLVVLLRSLTAPLILLVTTVLSYLTALGISALVFNYAFGFPGADPTVPLFGFVFLVALGVDYNIFLTTRAREETRLRGPSEGLLHALVVTGGVITSAGIVLAATFAALAVLPLMFMVQLAFLVAVGVLIDTFVVRTLQVPALGVDVGAGLWWPSSLRQRPEPQRT